jgi:hypothetical protein
MIYLCKSAFTCLFTDIKKPANNDEKHLWRYITTTFSVLFI